MPPPDELIFETERLWIRQYADSDADRMYDTLRRWEVSRWLGDAPSVMLARDEAVRRIAAWRKLAEANPSQGIWAIEVGWHLHPDSWGHGYAREAGAAAVSKGFADGLEEVHAFVRPENKPSVRVCEAIGMEQYRISRDEWYRGEWLQYRITRQERP